MKRIILAVACGVGILATSACETILGPSELQTPFPENPPIASQPYDMLVEGKPNLDLIRAKGGYYIWKIGDAWHVRVARTDLQPANWNDLFLGTIGIEGGYITNVEAENLQPPDDMRSNRNDIIYRFEVGSEVKILNFRVKPITSEYCMTFAPQVNGLANPEYVRLGTAMVMPEVVPIKICVLGHSRY